MSSTPSHRPSTSCSAGVHPDTHAIAGVLANRGLPAPHTGQPLSEAMVLGVGGGLGAGYILWEFKAQDYRTLVFGFRNSWQYPDRWAIRTCARLHVPAGMHETGSAKHLSRRSDSFSLPAFRKWEWLLTTTGNAKAWPRVFADRVSLFDACLSIYENLEPSGWNGGHLRGLYADFLDEAAALLEARALAPAAAAYRQAAARWHEVAEVALPGDVEPFAEARRLIDRLQAQVERGDDGRA